MSEQFCTAKYMVLGTNGIIMYPLELSKIINKGTYNTSENEQMKC